MTNEDRALLEDAARAAGIDLAYDMENGNPCMRDMKGGGAYWNPLTDPGDAMRLAVRFGILVLTARGFAVANATDSGGGVVRISLDDDADRLAATCRAITRAAAEIWRQR